MNCRGLRSAVWMAAALLMVGLVSVTAGGCAAPEAEPPAEEVAVEAVAADVTTPGSGEPSADADAGTAPEAKTPDDTFVSVGNPDPASLDPATVYEFGGIGIDMLLYDGLVAFEREKADAFVPALATEWSVSDDGRVYTFTVRSGVTFHDGGTLEPHDAAYSLQRAMLQDPSGGPAWLLLGPILGASSMTELAIREGGVEVADGAEPPAMADLPESARQAACEAVLAAVVADDEAGTVAVRLQEATPWFLQLLATWIGSVLDREWMVAEGDWDGTCSQWTKWHDIAAEESPIFDRANGTGPYMLGAWAKSESVTLTANEAYWRTEPAWPGGPSGAPRIANLILQNVPEWGTRWTKLQAGEADGVYVPLPEIDQVEPLVWTAFNGRDESAPSEVRNPDGTLKLFVGYPVGSAVAMPFGFTVVAEGGNEFIGSGALDGEGIPPDFFSDEHVRRGFSYCFDYETYIRDVLRGDGIKSQGPIIEGLDGYSADSDIYAFDLDRCEQELAEAWDGALAASGFRVVVPYAEGWVEAQSAFELLADGLSQVDQRYRLETVQMQWPTMLDAITGRRVPLSMTGWQEDYHDASNWAFAYLHSRGANAGGQSMPSDLQGQLDELVARAAIELDPAKRDAMYAELQSIAVTEATAIWLTQAVGRTYVRREVGGFYANPLAWSLPFYAMWKGEPASQ